jgi:regulator of protease activity HflC (stomatin/prohibitin superfamily)
MKTLRIISALVILAFIGGVIVFANLQKVEIGQVGVLTKEWGGGLVKEDYTPGYYMDMGPLHTWAIFDATVQTLERSRQATKGPFVVKSVDGADVTLDLNIKYRIKPGSAWRVLERFGPGDAYQEKVHNESVDALRAIFGDLSTEAFYDPEMRATTAEKTQVKLKERLESSHVELVEILIRNVSFSKSYETRIMQKELAKQEALVNISQRKAAEVAGDTNKIMAETAAKVRVIEETMAKDIQEMSAENEKNVTRIEAEAHQYSIEKRADADLYKAEKLAAADLLLRNAEAEAQQLRQMALTGPGAANLVALETAQSLNFGQLTISTLANNILDLRALAEKLGAKGDK